MLCFLCQSRRTSESMTCGVLFVSPGLLILSITCGVFCDSPWLLKVSIKCGVFCVSPGWTTKSICNMWCFLCQSRRISDSPEGLLKASITCSVFCVSVSPLNVMSCLCQCSPYVCHDWSVSVSTLLCQVLSVTVNVHSVHVMLCLCRCPPSIWNILPLCTVYLLHVMFCLHHCPCSMSCLCQCPPGTCHVLSAS